MGILKNILFEFILLTTSLCYIKFFNIGTNTDIQIYYFIFCSIYIFTCLIDEKNKKIYNFNMRIIIYSIIFFIFTFIIELSISKVNIIYFRSLYSCISFLCVFMCFINLYNDFSIKKTEKRIKFYYWIWNIIGFIQVFRKLAFTTWINRIGSDSMRGSISLGSEPFYYALHLILSSLILYIISEKNKKYILISLFPILFFAKSSQGLIYAFIIVLIIFFNKKKILINFLSIIILLLVINFLFVFLKESRIYLNFSKLLLNPKQLLEQDGSIGSRILQWIILWKGSKENFFLPNGFIKWHDYFKENIKNYIDLFPWIKYVLNKETNKINKIGSMLGAMLFELGIVFTIVFYGKIYLVLKKYNKKIFFIILLLSIHGLNLTNPFFAILISILYIKNKRIKLK